MTSDWQDNPGHMPVAAEVEVYPWLAMFADEPPCRTPIQAGKLKWMLGFPGEIAKWKRA